MKIFKKYIYLELIKDFYNFISNLLKFVFLSDDF